MPLCKNDPKKSYKGNEPSPKGLGYCAHAEKLGVSKKGKDGNIWKNEVTVKGVKRWVKHKSKILKEEKNNKIDEKNIDCSKFVIYEKIKKSSNGVKIKILMGISLRKGYIYKYIDFNLFEKEETKIPEGFTKRSISKDIKLNNCDKNKKILKKDNEDYKKIKEKLKDYKTYFIHDNYNRLFLVYVKNKIIHIYKRPSNKYYISKNDLSLIDNKNKCFYIELVNTYKCKKIFVGQSPKCDTTLFSKGYGKKFDGNSILLHIDSNKYVYIGDSIFEFKIDDIINEYYSPVGNNDVPYPIALGSNNIYFIIDKTYVSNEKIRNLDKKNKIDAYSYYYGHKGNEKLSNYSKKIKFIKIIQKRI